jgi:hypothetical protein
MCLSLKSVVEWKTWPQGSRETGKMSTKLLARRVVIPAQTNVDPTRIIHCVLAAEGTVIRKCLCFVAHPAKCLIRRSRGRRNFRYAAT